MHQRTRRVTKINRRGPVGNRTTRDTPPARTGGGTTVVSAAILDDPRRERVVNTAAVARRSITSMGASPPFLPQVRMLVLGKRRLRAGLLLPRGHLTGQKLPVLLNPYGGPHAQRVMSSSLS